MNFIGWLGSIMLALCAVPEVIQTYRNKRCAVSWGMLILWGGGEILVLISILDKMSTFINKLLA